MDGPDGERVVVLVHEHGEPVVPRGGTRGEVGVAQVVLQLEVGRVPVMAVGDQELGARERLRHALLPVEPPQASPAGLEVGRAVGHRERRGTVVQEEERLELGLRRPQETQAPAPRARVRLLVRQHDAVGVRLGSQRRGDPCPAAPGAVAHGDVLLEHPHGGIVVADEHPLVEPLAEAPAGSGLVRVRCQPDDVVRIACAQRRLRLLVQHVVRQRRDVCARPGVRDRAERTDVGHPTSLHSPR